MDIRNQEPFKSLLAICKSPATAYSYRWDLEKYLKYLKEIKTDIYKVKFTQMEGYVLWLRESHVCDRTIKRRLAPVVKLYHRLLMDHEIKEDPTIVFRGIDFSPDNPPSRALSREQIKIIMDSLKWDTEDEKITSMAILLGYHCGLRLHEIQKVKTTDFQDGILTVIGKREKKRFLPISSEVQKHLGDFKPGPIFNIGKSAIYRHLKRKARSLGFDWSTHWLRHRFCTTLIEAGEALTTAADLAGHSSTDTTRRYVTTAMETKKAAIQKAF